MLNNRKEAEIWRLYNPNNTEVASFVKVVRTVLSKCSRALDNSLDIESEGEKNHEEEGIEEKPN